MADLELASKFESDFVCDFCGYRCNDEALYDDHLQSHIVGCYTTSSEFKEEFSDDVTRRTLSSDEPRFGASVNDECNSANNGKLYGSTPVYQNPCSLRDAQGMVSVLRTDKAVEFNCAVCGVGFPTSVLYQQHVRTHVQKIDAALSRQVICPEIVPVTIVPREAGKLPLVKIGDPLRTEVKPQSVENCKPKLITNKPYNDKLSDTVEALRLSLQKPSGVPNATAVTGSSVDTSSTLLVTAGVPAEIEVAVQTATNESDRTADGAASLASRKRKQKLLQRAVLPSLNKTDVQHDSGLYYDLEVGSKSQDVAQDKPGKETQYRRNDGSSDEETTFGLERGAGPKEDSENLNAGSKLANLLQEHSYPTLAPKPSSQNLHPLLPKVSKTTDRAVTVFSPANKSFECNICGAKYSALKNLNRHLKTHRKEKRRKVDLPVGQGHLPAPIPKKNKVALKDSPLKIAKNFGIDINSKMLDNIQKLDNFNKSKSREKPGPKPAMLPSSDSQHWVSKKMQQQRPSSFLNIKCFCGRKFNTVPSFRKHMQCHVHGPSRVNLQNNDDDDADDVDDNVRAESNTPVNYDTEDTVESVYNLLRNDLGNASLPSFVTEKAPRPKTAPDRSQFHCPQCGAGFTRFRTMSNHVGSKRCEANVRQNWQAAKKKNITSKPSNCSDCGAVMPSYAPKVLARHITNVPDDEVKCRFCLLKLDRIRNAANRKDFPEKAGDIIPGSGGKDIPGIVLPDVSESEKVSEGDKTFNVDNSMNTKPDVPAQLTTDAIQIAKTIDHKSVPDILKSKVSESVPENVKNIVPLSKDNNVQSTANKDLVCATVRPNSTDSVVTRPDARECEKPIALVHDSVCSTSFVVESNAVERRLKELDAKLNHSNKLGLANNSETASAAKALSVSSGVTSPNVAVPTDIGAELKKEYKCNSCGLVYFSEWSFSRHRQKFCGPKTNSGSDILTKPPDTSFENHGATTSTERPNSVDLGEVTKSNSTEFPKSADWSDVSKSDDSDEAMEDDDEDKLSEHSGGLIGIDLGDSSDDELPSKADSGDENEDSDDSDSDIYLCNFCDNRSTSPLSYKEHLQTHVSVVAGTDEHTSFYCKKCATHTSNILHQCRSTFEPRASTCGICLRQFQSMESAKMHALKCHDNTKLIFCRGCYWGLGSNEELKEHVSECEGCVIRSSPRPDTASPPPTECGTGADSESTEIQLLDSEPSNLVLSSAEEEWSPPPTLSTNRQSGAKDSTSPERSTSSLLVECSKPMEEAFSSPLPNPLGIVHASEESSPVQELILEEKCSTPIRSSNILDDVASSPSSDCFDTTVELTSSPSSSQGTLNLSSSPQNVHSPFAEKVASASSPDDSESSPNAASSFQSKRHPALLQAPRQSELSAETSACRKQLSYAEILGYKPLPRESAKPPAQPSNSDSDVKGYCGKAQSPLTPLDDLGDTLSSLVLPPSKPSCRSKGNSETHATPSTSSTTRDSETECSNNLDFTCYSPEMVSSPAECSDIQSEIDNIISKLPALRSGVSPDNVCSSDERRVHSPKRSTSQEHSPPTSPLFRKRKMPKCIPDSPDVPSATIPTPLESNNPPASPVLRKRKLPNSSPDLPGVLSFESTSPSGSFDAPSGTVTPVESPKSKVVIRKTSPGSNGLKLKIVRIATPQKGKSVLKKSVTYRLISEPLDAPGLQLPSNVANNATSAGESSLLRVQGAVIDSTIRNTLGANALASDPSSSVVKERIPLLQHLFREIHGAELNAKTTDTGHGSNKRTNFTPTFCDVSAVSAPMQTSPPNKLDFVSKKCTARKSIKPTQPGRQPLARRRPLIDNTCALGAVFTDADGIQHLLPECRVQLLRLDKPATKTRRPNSAGVPRVIGKSFALEDSAQSGSSGKNLIVPVESDKSIVKSNEVEEGRMNPPKDKTPKFAINKILSSIKRFIQPSTSQMERPAEVSTTDSLTPPTSDLKGDGADSRSQNEVVVMSGSPSRSASPAESEFSAPVFRRRVGRNYTRTSLSKPLRQTRSTTKVNNLCSPEKTESPLTDSLLKGDASARDGNINKILSAFRSLIDHRDIARSSSTPP